MWLYAYVYLFKSISSICASIIDLTIHNTDFDVIFTLLHLSHNSVAVISQVHLT